MAEEEKPQGEGAEKGADRLRGGAVGGFVDVPVDSQEPPIEVDKLYEKLSAMSEEERIAILDPICAGMRPYLAERIKVGGLVAPNRIFALVVLDIYERWNREIMSRE